MTALSISKPTGVLADHPHKAYIIVTRGAAVVVLLFSLFALLGWLLDVPTLKGILSSSVSMNPVTAVAFAFCAVALWFLPRMKPPSETERPARPHGLLSVCLFPVLLIGLLRLSDYALGTSFGIDRLLFSASLGDNQIAPNTALAFVFASLAFAFSNRDDYLQEKWIVVIRNSLLLVLFSVAYLAVVGYVLQADRLYHVTNHIPMALNTALCFALLAVGGISAFPNQEPLRTLLHTSPGGISARRLLILAFGVPVLLGWLRLEGEWRGYYNTATAAAIVATLTTGVFAAVIWREARQQQRLESELQTANAQIRQNEQLFRAVLETLPVGVQVVDRKGDTTTRNPAAEAIWMSSHRSKGGSEGSPPGWWSDSSQPVVEEDWPLTRALIRGESMVNAEIDIVCSDGTRKTILTSGISLRDDHSQITGAIGVSQDITHRKEAERALAASEAEVRRSNDELEQRVQERTSELEATNRALQDREAQLLQAQKLEVVGRLAGGIAHDFNNMLTAITMYTEMIQWAPDLNEEVRHDLGEVQRVVQRATSLTRQLLAFSRKQVVAPQRLDLRETVSGIHAMLHRLIGEDIDLVTVPAPSPTPILADPGQIEQILTNLVVNARDAMPQGGKITVETLPVTLDASYGRGHSQVEPGEYVLLAVSDTGQGMDAETLSHVFEPFFTTKEVGKGTGLGLSTVYGIVQQSGGHIHVYSEPGVGTTFKIYFPRDTDATCAPVAAPEIQRVPLPTGIETILLVEDDAAVRTVIQGILKKSGYTVLEALTGEQALQIIERHTQPIDLLLTDLVMPQMSGRELAERVHVRLPDLRVLYMSGYTDDAVVRHGILTAEVAYLQKPFATLQLVQKVRQVLDCSESRRL